ncbi:hypothetical protein PS1_047400 [Malus domestica]
MASTIKQGEAAVQGGGSIKFERVLGSGERDCSFSGFECGLQKGDCSFSGSEHGSKRGLLIFDCRCNDDDGSSTTLSLISRYYRY